MFKCNCCGNIFEEGEEGTRREYIGSFWGAPAYKEYDVCPSCRSDDFDEAENCEICGEVVASDDCYDGVCPNCIVKNFMNWELCKRACKNDKQPYELSAFWAWVFEDDEIEKILYNELKKRDYVNCTDFIVDNPEAIAEQLKKEKEEAKK